MVSVAVLFRGELGSECNFENWYEQQIRNTGGLKDHEAEEGKVFVCGFIFLTKVSCEIWRPDLPRRCPKVNFILSLLAITHKNTKA